MKKISWAIGGGPSKYAHVFASFYTSLLL